MGDYIDRGKLLKKSWDTDTHRGYCWVVDVGTIEKAQKEDVAPVVHARWIVKSVGYAEKLAFCSGCGCQSCTNIQTFHEQGADITEYKPVMTKYCPNCGAKMEEDND